MAGDGGTKQRIQQTARELFARQGVQRTSLQEIADRLGITKPALYYHYASREDLVRSIVQPMIDAGEEFVCRQEALAKVDVRTLLEGFFDFHLGHRAELVVVLTEPNTLTDLGLIELVMTWRERLARLMYGDNPTLEQSTRAVIALGGLQDCATQFADVPASELRTASVDGALAALGLRSSDPI